MGNAFTLPRVLFRQRLTFPWFIARYYCSQPLFFVFQTHLRRFGTDKFPRPTQTQAQRYKSALASLCIPTWQLSTFLLAFVLAFELSPLTRVKYERKQKSKRWSKKWALKLTSLTWISAWRLSCPSTCPKQEQIILRIVLLMRLLSFGVLSLLVQRKRLFCKIRCEERIQNSAARNKIHFVFAVSVWS